MIAQENLENKVCPIDNTQLRSRNLGGWVHTYCEYCGAVYHDLNKRGLIKKAKEYLKLLQELNEADLKKIIDRNGIIKKGYQNISMSLEKFVENLVKNSLRKIKDRPHYRDFVLEELDKYAKKKLWESFKYEISPFIAFFYGEQFPEIIKIFYGDIASGEWIQTEEQGTERVTGADLDLLIIVSDISVIPAINKITDEIDPYFIKFLRDEPFTAERIGDNFLEIHPNDNYARQAEKDPSSCGAHLIYKRQKDS